MSRPVDGRAVHRAPLTEAQRELVLSCAGWLPAECRRQPGWLAARIGWDGVEQEAWHAVAKAAHDFDPVQYPGVPFGAFARRGVRTHLMGVRTRLGIKTRVWIGMPVNSDGEQVLEPADHRGPEVHPALHAWCSDEYRRQRRCLDMRRRVILYLRTVEGWTLDETAAALALARERVRRIQERAVSKLAAFRNRSRLRDQLAGVAT